MIELSCVLKNLEWIKTSKSFALPEYEDAVFEESSIILSERKKCRTQKELIEQLQQRQFRAIPISYDIVSSCISVQHNNSKVLGRAIINSILSWQFFPVEVGRTIPRQRSYKDYVNLGLLSYEEVHDVLTALFPATSQCKLLAYVILQSRLINHSNYNHANYLDLSLLQLIDDVYVDGNYKPLVHTRVCKLCGKLYVDTFHPTRASTTFGYDPYCQGCSGDGGSEWCNLDAKPPDLEEDIDDLQLLKCYSDAIGTVPTKETMRSIIAPPCGVKRVFDAWVRLPSYSFYTSKYGDFRIPLIKIGVLPEQVLSGKYGYLCIAKDGHKCRSLAELKIDNFLYENGVEHEIEPLYPFHDKYNKNGRRRADWKIGNAYVEYWGLADQDHYRRKMQDKINMAEELSIPLIGITQVDLLNLSVILRKIRLHV